MTAPMQRRWLLLCAIGVAVVGLHLALLSVLGPAWFDPEGPPATPVDAMQVRHWVLAAPVPATVLAPVVRDVKKARAPPVARIAPRNEPISAPAPVATAPAAAFAPLAEAPAASAETALYVPVYATRLPPMGRWRYRMQRGLALGEAELRWVLQADGRYELQLEGRVSGVTLLDWISQGQIDAAGVAPERFAVRRGGRDRQAANFQREAGKITFSGPTHEQPLLPGVQDRLSWMIQLAAIVAAEPERFVSGAAVVLFVAGARGDAEVWTFVVQGTEALEGTPTLKLLREPRKLYDTRIEVWLDPADHYLPLRALQTPSGGGSALELQREREPR